QPVDATRLESLEVAAPEGRRLEDAREVGARRRDRVAGHDVVDQRPALAGECVDDRVDGRFGPCGGFADRGHHYPLRATWSAGARVYGGVYTMRRCQATPGFCSIAPPAGPPSC